MGQTRVDPVDCARMIVYRRMVHDLRPHRAVSAVANAREWWNPRIAALLTALSLLTALAACVLAAQP